MVWQARTAVGMLLLLAAALGCGRRPGAYSVILISLDTLRADRIGAYGYARDTTPNIDAFAKRGTLFEDVVAECSWTLPSHVTMLSGLFPSTHGAVLPSLRPGPETLLLAERFHEAGYRTLGLTDGGYVGARYGFGRGFESFDDSEKGLAATLERARSFLDGLRGHERFFLFLHTYDIHCPYVPAPPYAGRYASADAELVETKGLCGNPDFNRMRLRPGQARYLSDRYDESIQEADASLGAFLRGLEESGRLRDTIVLITSDHGEEFLEHGQIGHERTLYREALGVPLVVFGAAIPIARRIDAAGLVDVAPTILDACGLGAPPGLEGRPLFRDRQGSARFSELSWQVSLQSVTTGTHQLVWDALAHRGQLFARTDTLERLDQASSRAALADSLRSLIEDYARARQPRRAAPLEALTEEQRARLRQLGYIN